MDLSHQIAGESLTLAASGLEPSWLVAFGLGCLWLGGQIVWVAPLPRQIRRWRGHTDIPTAEAGTPAAFGLFWIDQYGWIGICLCVTGALAILVGAVS